MKRVFLLILILAVSGSYIKINAQSLRPPTPAEKIVLQKVVDALNRITGSFTDNNWDVEDNNFDPELYVPISVQAHCGIGYTIKLGLKQGSPLYHKVMDPMQTLMNGSKPYNIDSLGSITEKLSEVVIDIELNAGAISYGTNPKKNKQLKVEGASKAYIQAENNNNPSENGAFILAFGNWGNAKNDVDNKCFRFKFNHPPQTPFIENISILMHGNDDKIAQIIKDADWNSLNDALTK